MEKVFCIIPARYGSTRARGKLLRLIFDKPLIEWTWRNAMKVSSFCNVFVATDSKEIADSVKNFGGKVIKTSSSHKCGTDRIAEAARILRIADKDIIVNVQADEPLVSSLAIEKLIVSLRKSKTFGMATLAYPSSDAGKYENKNVVKVVVDNNDFALYFSRSPIPSCPPKRFVGRRGYCDRIKNDFSPLEMEKRGHEVSLTGFAFLKHFGIYAYRMNFLQKIAKLSVSKLEEREKLEQLRVLENGYKIKVVNSPFDCESVNTIQDFKTVENLLKAHNQKQLTP